VFGVLGTGFIGTYKNLNRSLTQLGIRLSIITPVNPKTRRKRMKPRIGSVWLAITVIVVMISAGIGIDVGAQSQMQQGKADTTARKGKTSAPDTAIACRQRAEAQDRFEMLSQQIRQDRQVIKNFGFERTVEDFEAWAKLGKEGQDRFVKGLYSTGLAAVLEGMPLAAARLAPKVTSNRAISMYNLLKRAGRPNEAEHWYEQIVSPILAGKQVPVETFARQFAEDANKIAFGLNTLDPENLVDSVLSVAKWAAPQYAPFLEALQVANWLGPLIWKGLKATYEVDAVNKATFLTEDQLKELRNRSDALARRIDELSGVKIMLDGLAPCDTTELSRKPGDSGGALGTALVIGGVVAAGVAVAAAAPLLKQQSQTGGGGACISSRNCVVSALGNPCSCSQATATGPCNWTGPVAREGEACRAGVPCAQGLSCNNGRCEGRSGRCPF
jgi:hypothetical protein